MRSAFQALVLIGGRVSGRLSSGEGRIFPLTGAGVFDIARVYAKATKYRRRYTQRRQGLESGICFVLSRQVSKKEMW